MEHEVGKIFESLMNHLESLKELKSCFNSEDEDQLENLISQCLKFIQDIRGVLCKSMERRLSTMKIGRVFKDPSVQFFGIDWDFLFPKCAELKDNLTAVMTNSDVVLVDEILLSLLSLEDQVLQHSVALMSGNLGKKKQREQEMMQRRVALMATSKEQNKPIVSKTGKRRKSFSVSLIVQRLFLRFK